MIVFDLRCGQEHVFEAWFKDSDTFDAQVAAGEVRCPVCGDTKVSKSVMAPRLNTGTREQAAADTRKYAVMHEALRELRRQVEDNCDYVGDKFPEEARKIHYGETDPRGIYGEATPDEARSLADEGVAVQPIPLLPREDA